MCRNRPMKALAWIALILAGILALGFFLVLVDLVFTKFANGSVSSYEDMGLALVLFFVSACVTLRSFQCIRLQRIEAANPKGSERP
jgi:hypothetical protein